MLQRSPNSVLRVFLLWACPVVLKRVLNMLYMQVYVCLVVPLSSQQTVSDDSRQAAPAQSCSPYSLQGTTENTDLSFEVAVEMQHGLQDSSCSVKVLTDASHKC